MSEFYRIRRGQITDLTGLVFFIIGWLGSAPFAWPRIKEGFDRGSPTSGIFKFAVFIFSVGIALGLFGMVVGMVAGRIWEMTHRRRRARVQELRPNTVPSFEKTSREMPKVREPLPPLRYDTGDPGITAYAALASKVGDSTFDHIHAAAALQHSSNVTAWEGDKLVGIARVVTDGYFFAALADILVDPSLQRRGLGRELINRAYERTPRGVLFVGAPFGNSVFFDRIGCERGLTGFTLRQPAKAQTPS